MRMKRLLMGTTALAASGLMLTGAPSPAQAQLEVSLGGYGRFRAFFVEEDGLGAAAPIGQPPGTPATDRGYAFDFDTEIVPQARGVTDTGITYGFKVELQANTWNSLNADEAMLFFSGAFGRIELGNEDGAADSMALGAHTIAAGTGGIDGSARGIVTGDVKIRDSGDATKITYYTPRVAGFQLGASFTPDTGNDEVRFSSDADAGQYENHIEVGANYVGSFSGVDLGLAATGVFGDEETGGTDQRNFSLGGTVGFAGARFGALWGRDRPGTGGATRDNFFTLGGAYGFGPVTASLTYNHRKPKGGDRRQGGFLSGTYALFPGVRLQGDVGYQDVDGGVDRWTSVFVVRMDF